MKTIIKMVVAVLAAMTLAVVCIALGASGKVVVVVYAASGIGIAAMLGVFTMPGHRERHTRIKDAARSIRDAA